VLDVLTSERFRNHSPRQIVPTLADEGIYVASESTMYRVLHGEQLLAHRGRARPPMHHRPPELVASAVNTVWSWNITYLRGPVRGGFFYLHLLEDLCSRSIVGWEVHEEESAEAAAKLVERTCQTLDVESDGLHLHSDSGAPMKGATLQQLGVVAPFNRPRVSDDNPYSEALFRTLKYRPGFPNRASMIFTKHVNGSARDWSPAATVVLNPHQVINSEAAA